MREGGAALRTAYPTLADVADADVRVATMPEGLKDPDEALRAMGVDEYVAGVIKPAVGWVEWLAAKELAAYEASGLVGNASPAAGA